MESMILTKGRKRTGIAMAIVVAIAVPTVSLLVGRTVAVAASAAAPDATITTTNVKSVETDSGDLVADAVRAGLGADIGFAPAAAFKASASIPRPANADQAATLVEPGSDTLSLLTLRGDQIIAALERSVSFEPQASSGFLQVSGLRFTYDARKEGGKRVASVTVNGQPLDASKTYKVATTRPLAHGQQGYFQIWDNKSDIAKDDTKTIDTAIRDHVKSRGGSVSPATDGRIMEIEK